VRDYDRRSSDQKVQDAQDETKELLRLLLEAGAIRYVPADLVERLEESGVYYTRAEGAVTNWELRQMTEAEPEGIGDVATTAVKMLAAELLRTRTVVEAVIKARVMGHPMADDTDVTKALTAFLGGE